MISKPTRRAIPEHVPYRVRQGADYLNVGFDRGPDCLQKSNYNEDKCRKEVRRIQLLELP